MQVYRGRKHTLVATLGGQPQIVTFTLDLLLRRGIPIYEVIVVHPASSPHLQQSSGGYCSADTCLALHVQIVRCSLRRRYLT
jgi:hypothetical protein